MVEKVIRRRSAKFDRSLDDLNLHPLLTRIYCARGVAVDQLDLGLEHLIPPEELLGIVKAAGLLADALIANARVLVVGDFDADGATSTTVAISALKQFGLEDIAYLVPNRFEYGYGLTPEIVELAKASHPDLIITVDNGISSLEGVRVAREAGISTLITDHHLPGRELPEADVIVNPNQPGCAFPSKNLAGVGVIFYLMLALRSELRRRGCFDQQTEPNLGQFTDLVALGTVADVVPLDRNNRILVNAGLRRIRAGKARPGIRALLDVASRNLTSVVASDLGYAVGPRINAAGRLDDISIGIECLLSEDLARAASLAKQLHQLNQDRRLIEHDMQAEALQALGEINLLSTDELPMAMTLYRGGWHQGVIGILASRIKDRIHRPTIAFADAEGGEIKGSARSIPGIHVRDILDAVAARNPGLITRFGGHAMAAGLTMARADYERFAQAFLEEVERHAQDVELSAVIESDGELAEQDFDLNLAKALRFAGPWGQHFPEPVFDGIFQLVNQRLVGEKHLKMALFPADGSTLLDAIAFNVDPHRWPDHSVERIKVAYRLDVNEFRGQQRLQLVVEHFEPA
ncbi:MAG: single-stranded-DNA-specific exonuclease RecJ [Pseudomonadota bacterium]